MDAPAALVVDDDLAIRTLIGKVLERSGLKVTLAADGAEAIRLFDSSHYDVVVLDLMMPSVSGYDVLDHVEPLLDGYTAVVVVTAGADEDTVRLRGRRVHSFIRKPFDIAMLSDLVVAVARQMAEAHRNRRDTGGTVVVVDFQK